MIRDMPDGATECEKCGSPIWEKYNTPHEDITEERVEVTFVLNGRNYTERYPPACLTHHTN